MLRTFAIALAGLLSLAFLNAPARADLVDDFGSYGTTLTNGERGPLGVYNWGISNRVPTHSPQSLDVNSFGLKLAGYPRERHTGYAGLATATFTAGNQPVMSNFGLAFDIRERHDKLELDIQAAGKSAAVFTFTGQGRADLVFSSTDIKEYLNGILVQTRSYTSLGWADTDIVESFTFKGIHHDSGNSFVYVDNMRVTTGIPEPGSLLLASLGLGLAGAVRRRRR